MANIKNRKIFIFIFILFCSVLYISGCSAGNLEISELESKEYDDDGCLIVPEDYIVLEIYGKDGDVIIESIKVKYKKNLSVADISREVCRYKKIPIIFAGIGSISYVQGINNLFEFEYGSQSGWLYAVNREYQGGGCGSYILNGGDYVEWRYTLDLGKDIGAFFLGEQSVSDLYANAGIKSDKIFISDPFDLTLSHNNYFYTEDIYVEITSDIKDAEIYYTLDGSVPSKKNARNNTRENEINGTEKYNGPIIFYRTEVNEPYVLKFIAYSEGTESKVITHTYFVNHKINERFDESTLVFSVSSDPYNLYDYEYGILIEGKLRDDFILENPQAEINPATPANYNIRGRESEREAYIEVLNSDGRLLISQTAGIRVHGGWSRGYSGTKSIAIYARQEYDPIFDRFYYPFFGDDRRNDEYGSFICDYKALLLRNGGNDMGEAYLREELGQALAKKAGFLDYKEFAPAVVFLNGQFYGFLWLQTFYHTSYFMDTYGGNNSDLYDRLHWYDEPKPGDMTDDQKFFEYSEVMDLDNFMLYYAFEIFSGNWDWPQNNRRAWRYNNSIDGPDINKYYDGKLRMLLYDVEGGWGHGSSSSADIRRVVNGGDAPAFSALMKRADMIEKFCNQMFDLINTVFLYESFEEELNKIVDIYDYEVQTAIRAGSHPTTSIKHMESQRDTILRFAQRRPGFLIDDMTRTFKLNGETYDVNIIGKTGADINLNTINLSGAVNLESCYFTEHKVILKAEPHAGYLFDYWEINGNKYLTPEVILHTDCALDGVITAEIFIKPDDSYSDIEISRIRLDDYCDIIELYNPGNNETVVTDLYLSNDKNNLKKFYIKKLTISPESIMTYYGQNYANNRDTIKTSYIFDFKIKKGETIYLSDDNGNIIKEVYITEMFNTNKDEEIIRDYSGSYRIIKSVKNFV